MFPLYSKFLSRKPENIPVPTPNKGGGGSSGGGGGTPIYDKNGNIIAPGGVYKNTNLLNNNIVENFTFEYDVLTNRFKGMVVDEYGNKKYLLNSWLKDHNKYNNTDNYYITDNNGNILAGWVYIDGGLYYFSENATDYGCMKKGVITVGNENYILDENGKYVDSVERFPICNQMVVTNGYANNINANVNDTEVSAMNGTQVFGTRWDEEDDDDDANTYIKYYSESGDLIRTQNVNRNVEKYNKNTGEYTVTLSLVPPAIANKEFSCWLWENAPAGTKDSEKYLQSGITVVIRGIVKLKAQYKSCEYNVIYCDSNGKTVYIDTSMTSTDYIIVADKIKNLPQYKMSRFELVGFTDVYSDDLEGSTAKYPFGTNLGKLNHDINLYPVRHCVEKYISDIVISTDLDSMEAKKYLTDNGYTVINIDLAENFGCRYSYLGYKTTDNEDEGITDLICNRGVVPHNRDNKIGDNTSYQGIDYTCAGSILFEFNLTPGWLSHDLYYTKSPIAGRPITNIYFDDKNQFSSDDDNNVSYYLKNYIPVMDTKNNRKADIHDKDEKIHKSLYFTKSKDHNIINPNVDINIIKSYNWMQKIPDNYLITEFNIPATHDSGCTYLAPIRESSTRTQYLTFNGQLQAGARVFDCRLGYQDGKLGFYHGDNLITEGTCYDNGYENGKRLLFETVLKKCINFVLTYDSETVILKLRYETRSESQYKNEAKRILEKYKITNILYLENRVPKLSEVRGKIVIMDGGWNNDERKLGMGIDWGEDNSNCYFYKTDKDGSHYSKKIDDIKSALNSENCSKKIVNMPGDPAHYYLNWICFNCWATKFEPEMRNPLPNPLANAKEVNKWFLSDCSLVKGRFYGWFAFDFINEDMAKKVYMSNFE